VRLRYPLWTILPLLLLTVTTVKSRSSPAMQRASLQRVPIETGWQFREAGKDNWYPATVPGSVHTDLLQNKVIDDPFYRDNEAKQQWIGRTNWEYRTTFQVTDALLAHKNLELVFEGLDTYADVYLNEKPILKADNMFRTWRVNCADVLTKGSNTLRISFRSPGERPVSILVA